MREKTPQTLASNLTVFMLSTLLVFTDVAIAESFLVSDWLKALEGSQGALIGAEVSEVIEHDDYTIVDVDLPTEILSEKPSVKAVDRSKKIITILKPTETLYDERDQPTGVRFYFNRAPGFEFRLRLYNALEKRDE